MESPTEASIPEIIDDPSLKTRSRIFWETVVTSVFGGYPLSAAIFPLFLLWVFSVHLMHQEIYELVTGNGAALQERRLVNLNYCPFNHTLELL